MKTLGFNRALFIAALMGLLAAIPVVVFVLTPAQSFIPAFEPLISAAALICPAWEIFWAIMGKPDDLTLGLKLALLVLTLNAVLYTPMGAVFVTTRELRPIWRRTLRAASYLVILGMGHLFFVCQSFI